MHKFKGITSSGSKEDSDSFIYGFEVGLQALVGDLRFKLLDNYIRIFTYL